MVIVVVVVTSQGSDLLYSGVEVRLAVLEAHEEACPRGLTAALAERVELMSAQQVRRLYAPPHAYVHTSSSGHAFHSHLHADLAQALYARSMEEVVKALVDDTSLLSDQAQV